MGPVTGPGLWRHCRRSWFNDGLRRLGCCGFCLWCRDRGGHGRTLFSPRRFFCLRGLFSFLFWDISNGVLGRYLRRTGAGCARGLGDWHTPLGPRVMRTWLWLLLPVPCCMRLIVPLISGHIRPLYHLQHGIPGLTDRIGDELLLEMDQEALLHDPLHQRVYHVSYHIFSILSSHHGQPVIFSEASRYDVHGHLRERSDSHRARLVPPRFRNCDTRQGLSGCPAPAPLSGLAAHGDPGIADRSVGGYQATRTLRPRAMTSQQGFLLPACRGSRDRLVTLTVIATVTRQPAAIGA